MSMFWKLYMMFDKRECAVSNGKRLFAYIIDWFLGSLVTMLPMCVLWLAWTQDQEGMAKANVLVIAGSVGDWQAYLAGGLSLLFALWYYVILPWKIMPGQTPGKRSMGFKITKLDGSKLDLKTLLIREVVGVIILEGAIYSASGIWHSMLSLAVNMNLVSILMYIGLFVSSVSGFITIKFQSHRMLHDYLAKTIVSEVVEEEKTLSQSI